LIVFYGLFILVTVAVNKKPLAGSFVYFLVDETSLSQSLITNGKAHTHTQVITYCAVVACWGQRSSNGYDG